MPPLSPASGDPTPTLQDRLPGVAVMEEFLRRDRLGPPRNAVQRVLGVRPVAAGSRSWYDGALGELAVGDRLRRLGPDWTVLHSVPVGRGSSDIDHVVVGPSGVYTLNTKRHFNKRVAANGDELRVAGRRVRHVANSRYEAERAAKLLTAAAGLAVHVHPVLVFTAAQQLTVKRRSRDLAMVTDRRLVPWLRRRPRTLSPEQVRHLVAIARRPATWHVAPPPAVDSRAVRQEFGAVQLRVRRAHVTRVCWSLALMLLLVGGVAYAWWALLLDQLIGP